MRKIFFFLFLLIFLSSSTTYSNAQSSYVLPYPSSMPGSLFYSPRLLWEKVSKYWYFGNFAQFSYNLKQSDKYLVEAKTLFEYKQYLLASNALLKSDEYFRRTFPNLERAQREGRDIQLSREVLSHAAEKHIEVLSSLKKLPEKFIWQPENAPASTIEIEKEIEKSIRQRMKYL